MEKQKEKKVDHQFYDLLHELQTIDFVLVELNLYLNTHPYDQQAIEQFNQFAYKRKEVVRKFEELYGPLSNFGQSYSKCPWQWKETPWPWQV